MRVRQAVAVAVAAFGFGIGMPSQTASGQSGTNVNGREATLAAARGEVDRARTQLRQATDKVRSTWNANPQWIAANDELEAARKEFQSARAAVIERLKTDPAYKAELDKHGDLKNKVRSEQNRTNANQPASTQPAGSSEAVPTLPTPSAAQVEAATEKLEQKAKLRNMEDIAVSNDSAAAKAQERLNKAQTNAKIWQAQLDAALKNDPDYRAALDQMNAARSRYAAAGGTPDVNYDNYGGVIYVR